MKSKRIATYLILCIGVLFAFVLLIIYPYHVSLVDADTEIEITKDRIEEQKLLFPVFKDLLNKAGLKESSLLPLPEKKKLARDQIDGVSSMIQKIAQRSNLKVGGIIPDVDSIIGGAGFLQMTVVMKGELFDLRNFLVLLGEVSYLEHIEQIQIRTTQDLKEIRLKLWMARE
jgi:hypothetical protein